MALGDPYAILAEFKDYVTVSETGTDTEITESLTAASREIESYCGRQFNNTNVASARVFQPQDCGLVLVDDFHTTTGLIVKVDADNDGVFETTLTASQYQLEPLNGIVDGQTGWPYNRIRARAGYHFPIYGNASVEVTAQWGWSSVPMPVKQACLIMANDNLKATREGKNVAVGGFNDGTSRAAAFARSRALLSGYRRFTKVVA